MNRILRTYQLAEAAAHDRPRGNLSDLYPRWLGARELLLRGRNPYDAFFERLPTAHFGGAMDICMMLRMVV